MKEKWRLLEFDGISGLDTQTVYHTVAIAMEEKPDIPNTLIICWPIDPVVCVGYHQIIEEEVDIEYCEKKKIPIYRRPLGGGAVYLDSGQLFYQIIARPDSKKIPKNVSKFYEKILQAPINTYRKIGINANFVPVNDIQTNGKKISGNGAAFVDGGRILTGNIIFDFNYEEMVKILKVPSEKFRNKIAKSLKERLGTIKHLLEDVPSREEVKSILIDQFAKTLDVEFEKTKEFSSEEIKINNMLKKKYKTNEWLNLPILRHTDLMEKRKVKISSTTQIYESVYKAPGGLIRLFLEIEDEFIKEILISGDFSANPMNAPELIEKELIGKLVNEKHMIAYISQIYQEKQIEIPGVTPEDFAKAIMLSVKDLF